MIAPLKRIKKEFVSRFIESLNMVVKSRRSRIQKERALEKRASEDRSYWRPKMVRGGGGGGGGD